MAGMGWTTPRALAVARRLQDEASRISFFRALRDIEGAHRDAPRIGHAERCGDEPIRFGQEPSLQPVLAAIADFSVTAGASVARLNLRFFGIFGADGPLPLHLTEYAWRRMRQHGDAALARFADLFHHRFIALFYRAWADAQPVVQHDRPETDTFLRQVGALAGLSDRAFTELGDDASIPAHVLAYYAGRWGSQVRNVSGLEAILSDYFQVGVGIEEFVGEWVHPSPDYVWRLGRYVRADSVEARPGLGRSTQFGGRVRLRRHRFRITLGPLDREQFERFRPGGPSVPRLRALVQAYVGESLAWDVRLRASAEAVQAPGLGKAGALGRGGWLIGPRRASQWNDLIFDPCNTASAAARETRANHE